MLNALSNPSDEAIFQPPNTIEISVKTHYSTEGARKHLEDLSAHHLVSVKKEGRAHTWELSELTLKYYQNLLPKSEIENFSKNIVVQTTSNYVNIINHLHNIPKEKI